MSATVYAQVQGRMLKQLRVDRGLGRVQLAQVAGVSSALLARYEDGRSLPDLYVLQQLATAMDVELPLLVLQIRIAYEIEQACVAAGAAPKERALVDVNPHRPYAKAGRKLSTWRFTVGLTQRELAAKLQATTALVSLYEIGMRRPSGRRRTMLEQITGGVVPVSMWT